MGEGTSAQAALNSSDPLTLHHSDHPSLVLVNTPLDGNNYGQWSRSMRIALSAKHKLGFIDGTIQAPAATDAKFSIWQRCNDMVLSWIWHSVNAAISSSILYCKTASAAWKDLEDRFSQGNDSRIYQIRQEIAEYRQGQSSVSDYYTTLKALWDELSSYHEPVACHCDGSKTLAEREEKERVMQFLMGLNDSYSTIRGSILMMSPLPDTRRVHGLILQHERQKDVASGRDSHSGVHAMQAHRFTPAKGSPSTGGPHSRRSLKCSYCHGEGHLVDRCFFLIGFPVGHKWHGKNVKPRHKDTAPVAHNAEAHQPLTDTPKAATSTTGPMFTTQEYNQILSMLRNGNGNGQPLANATGRGYEEDDWPGQAF